MQESFAALDAEMNKEFGGAESEGGSEDEDEPQGLYCVACGKSFKSDKQWQNHQKSKKHLNMVKKLKREMEADEDLMYAAVWTCGVSARRVPVIPHVLILGRMSVFFILLGPTQSGPRWTTRSRTATPPLSSVWTTSPWRSLPG